jgi:hypothetical protein
VILNWIALYTTLSILFVKGNKVFWHNIQAKECKMEEILHEEDFDNKIIWYIVGTTLAFNWIILIFIVQSIFFVILLATYWDTIKKVAKKLTDGLTLYTIVEHVVDAAGEGELQDSLTIGFL